MTNEKNRQRNKICYCKELSGNYHTQKYSNTNMGPSSRVDRTKDGLSKLEDTRIGFTKLNKRENRLKKSMERT
jgi:hypothetical protein